MQILLVMYHQSLKRIKSEVRVVARWREWYSKAWRQQWVLRCHWKESSDGETLIAVGIWF